MPRLSWLKLHILGADQSQRLRTLIREERFHAICEEISCANLPECLGRSTPGFPDRGQFSSRRCPGCAVDIGRPLVLDAAKPPHLAEAVRAMAVQHVVLTSEYRDDEADGGATGFLDCIKAVREAQPDIRVEILLPDFRRKLEHALDVLTENPPDVFNHNLQTVPRLYYQVRPGADYEGALELLRRIAQRFPEVQTTSGLMVGLGEEMDEIRALMRDLRIQDCRMLTIRQYLAPSDGHLPVQRYVRPEEFEGLRAYAEHIGFERVASGSFVRSSYRADLQAAGILSAAEPHKVLIVDGIGGGQGSLTAVGSLSHDFDIPSARARPSYRLTLDSSPLISRLM